MIKFKIMVFNAEIVQRPFKESYYEKLGLTMMSSWTLKVIGLEKIIKLAF